MITIPIKIRPLELKPIANFINYSFQKHKMQLEYLDFWNLRFFTKHLLDKAFKDHKSKQITMNININICYSLQKLSDKVEPFSTMEYGNGDVYITILFTQLIRQIQIEISRKEHIANSVFSIDKSDIFE